MKHVYHRLMYVGVMVLAGAASARTLPVEEAPASVWLAASDQELDHMRGGYNFGNGLTVSFGLTRSNYLNGQLVSTTTLQMNSLWSATKAAGSAAVTIPTSDSTPQLIQNGSGNVADLGVAPLPMASYIQNTLNNQTIRSQAVIDAVTNSMGILRGMRLQSSITESFGTANWLR